MNKTIRFQLKKVQKIPNRTKKIKNSIESKYKELANLRINLSLSHY